MSCDWDVTCVTCSCKNGPFNPATRVVMSVWNANHEVPLMEALIDGREIFERLADYVGGPDNKIWDLQIQVNYKNIDWSFFSDHRGHDLHPVNEYGEVGPCRRADKPCDLRTEEGTTTP